MVAPQLTQDKTDSNIPASDVEAIAEVNMAEKDRALCGRRGLLSLCFYAGAVTAALIVVIALGSMYQQQTMEMCELQQESNGKCPVPAQYPEETDDEGDQDEKTDHVRFRNGEEVDEEEITSSKNGRYETVISRPPNYTEPIITVIDMHRGLICVYNPNYKECYLMGGLQTEAGGGVKDNGEKEVQYDPSDSVNYDVIYEHPVKDKSLVPRHLKDVCMDKPTYWMQRETAESQSRKKRALCFTVKVCVNVRVWGWYKRLCYDKKKCYFGKK